MGFWKRIFGADLLASEQPKVADGSSVLIPDDIRKAFLDEHGQPRNRHLNSWRRDDRSINELLGLLKGVLADGIVQPEEALSIAQWLKANCEPDPPWPVDVVWRRMAQIVEDGRIDPSECKDLADLFRSIVEPGPAAEGHNASIGLAFTQPLPRLTFEGRFYVFTGKFYFGPRSKCERAVEERGGYCQREPTRNTDVVVIGAMGSRDWLHTSFGLKIERAVAYAGKGLPIAIVSEEHWTKHL